MPEHQPRPSRTRPRVLVLWAQRHSRNLGVRARAAGTEALVGMVWPEAELAYHGFGPGDGPGRVFEPRPLVRQPLQRRSVLSKSFRNPVSTVRAIPE